MTNYEVSNPDYAKQTSDAMTEIETMTQELGENKDNIEEYKKTLPPQELDNFESMEALTNKFSVVRPVVGDDGKPRAIFNRRLSGTPGTGYLITMFDEQGVTTYKGEFGDNSHISGEYVDKINNGEMIVTPAIEDEKVVGLLKFDKGHGHGPSAYKLKCASIKDFGGPNGLTPEEIKQLKHDLAYEEEYAIEEANKKIENRSSTSKVIEQLIG